MKQFPFFEKKKGVVTAAKNLVVVLVKVLLLNPFLPTVLEGILVEVNCETDFVAKNEDFVAFSNEIAGELLSNPSVDLEEKEPNKWRKIGENIQISRSEILTPASLDLLNLMCTPVLKLLSCYRLVPTLQISRPTTRWLQWLKIFACTLQPSPVCVNRKKCLQNWLKRRKKLPWLRQKVNLLRQSKKLSLGKLEKYYSGVCLLEQPFVKNPDQSIQQYVDEVGKLSGFS